ncbi:MAG: fasciclin domain-containing protein, partial [Bacillota bacterium]
YPSTILRAAQPIELTTLSSDELTVSLTGNTLNINPFANLEELDISATNGVIHSTNQVLLPPSLITEITGNLFDNAILDSVLFDALFESFSESGLITQLLSGESITIFLPNEDAFNDLTTTYDISMESLATSDIIVDILLYHIVEGDYLAEDLLLDAPLNLTSIEGSSLNITKDDSTIYINEAKVVSTFNAEEIGRVHNIDTVLLTDAMITELNTLNE